MNSKQNINKSTDKTYQNILNTYFDSINDIHDGKTVIKSRFNYCSMEDVNYEKYQKLISLAQQLTIDQIIDIINDITKNSYNEIENIIDSIYDEFQLNLKTILLKKFVQFTDNYKLQKSYDINSNLVIDEIRHSFNVFNEYFDSSVIHNIPMVNKNSPIFLIDTGNNTSKEHENFIDLKLDLIEKSSKSLNLYDYFEIDTSFITGNEYFSILNYQKSIIKLTFFIDPIILNLQDNEIMNNSDDTYKILIKKKQI